jgi:hypothetical protein
MLINEWQRTPPAWTQDDPLPVHQERGRKTEERRHPNVVSLREAEAREYAHGKKCACRLPSGTT